jgi:predicted unusual protein kinase regulating ubiquinone biosynthesis (AarF/ABC1/UbiB family)
MDTTQQTWSEMDVAGRIHRVAGTVDASLGLIGNALDSLGSLLIGLRQDTTAVANETERLYKLVSEVSPAYAAALRSTPRMARIVQEGVRMAASYRIWRKKTVFLVPAAAEAELAALHQANAERLRDLCLELGGGVLKAGQFLSCRVDLLPEPFIGPLSALQDRAPTVPFEAIKALVEAELKQPLTEAYATFDEVPLAAASLAQVHAATLKDGTEVAVKVQLPGVDTLVNIDMSALKILAQTLGDVIPGMDLKTIAAELDVSVRGELNYAKEAENTTAFAALWAHNPDIVVPEIIANRSAGRVLTLTRIHGERLLEYLEAHPEQRNRVLELMVSSFCVQVLDHGFFQADPHPGNFLVCEGPKLAILDFGAVQTFSPAERKAYAELAGSIMTRNTEKMAEQLTVLGFETKSGDTDTLVRFSEMLLDAFAQNVAFDQLALDPEAMLDEALSLA